MNNKEIKRIRTKYFILNGWDLNKDFFELSGIELVELEETRKMFGFSGKNNLGRSKDRQFWYYLQQGFRELIQQ